MTELYMVRIWNIDTATAVDEVSVDERHLASSIHWAQREIDKLEPDTDEMLAIVVVPMGGVEQ